METKRSTEPIPPMRRGANSYKPEDIRRWGVQRFMNESLPIKKPIRDTGPRLLPRKKTKEWTKYCNRNEKHQPMVFDTNLIIGHIRRLERLPAQTVIPMVVAGELEAFALKSDWGYQKVMFLQTILDYYPLVEVSRSLIGLYAR